MRGGEVFGRNFLHDLDLLGHDLLDLDLLLDDLGLDDLDFLLNDLGHDLLDDLGLRRGAGGQDHADDHQNPKQYGQLLDRHFSS